MIEINLEPTCKSWDLISSWGLTCKIGDLEDMLKVDITLGICMGASRSKTHKGKALTGTTCLREYGMPLDFLLSTSTLLCDNFPRAYFCMCVAQALHFHYQIDHLF